MNVCQLRSSEKWPVYVMVPTLALLWGFIFANLTACGTGTSIGRGTTQLKTPLVTPPPQPVQAETFTLPSQNTYLGAIIMGPDSNLWLTEGDANNIARVTTGGAITEFPDPTAGAYPALMTTGPDGNIWYSEYGANNIARITTAGVITEFPYTPPAGAAGGSNGQGIAFGPDGNIWFGYSGYGPACGGDTANAIEVMSPTGTLLATYTPPTPNAGPTFVVAGPDGNMWFAEVMANKIGRITMSGQITEYKIPTATPPYCAGAIGGLAVGPDGDIWFTERFNEKIGKITPSGVITEYGPYATGDYRFQRIIAGPDDKMWFAEAPSPGDPGSGIVSEMDTSGNLLEDLGWANGGPRALAIGPDNGIWYTDEFLDQVGDITNASASGLKHHHR